MIMRRVWPIWAQWSSHSSLTGANPSRSHCAHIAQTMRVTNGPRDISGGFVDLGHDGALVIRGDDGTVHRVTTGDVQLTGRL